MKIKVLSVFRDKSVQFISQIISALHASMSIEHTEIGRFLPICYMLWFGEVKNDGDSILIVLSE